MTSQTIVADVADELARRVAAGVYSPGDLMPSVRQVAVEFEVNRATAQLILGRLESEGFVEARRGKGFTIRDVRLAGGVDVYQRLFRLSMHLPEVALETFRDIVEVESALVLDTIKAYTQSDHPIPPEQLRADVDRLEAMAREPEPVLTDFLEVELAMLRNLLSAVGQTMQLATLNSIGEMVRDVPEATGAYFVASPDVHVLVWRALTSIWESGGEPRGSEVALFEDLMSMYHTRVIGRFEEFFEAASEIAEAESVAEHVATAS